MYEWSLGVSAFVYSPFHSRVDMGKAFYSRVKRLDRPDMQTVSLFSVFMQLKITAFVSPNNTPVKRVSSISSDFTLVKTRAENFSKIIYILHPQIIEIKRRKIEEFVNLSLCYF